MYIKIILNSAISHLRLLFYKPSGNHPSLQVNVSGTPLIKGSSSIVIVPRKFSIIQHNVWLHPLGDERSEESNLVQAGVSRHTNLITKRSVP